MPDTRFVIPSADLTRTGSKVGQGGLRNWFFPDDHRNRYLALAARWWEPHATANSFTANKVNAWHITFEEVDADYRKTGSRPALHREYEFASDSYICKGWKNGRPLAAASTHCIVEKPVEVPITADALLAELPVGLSYSSEDDYQAATPVRQRRTEATLAQAFLDRLTGTYLRWPLRWFGPDIAAPNWDFYPR